MKKCYITIKDEVHCYITGLQPADNDFLWQKFGLYKDGYFFAPAYKLGRWDGKIRLYEKTGKVAWRILEEILPYIEKWNYEIDFRDERIPVKTVETRITESWFAQHDIGLRPYQVEAINLMVEAGSGFTIAGTGAGKSLITAGLCDLYGQNGFRTCTVVPSADLVTQTADWYRDCGMNVGEYSGSTKELYCEHTVATWQSLQNNPNVMKFFGMVVIDEAHGAKAQVIQGLLNDHGKHIAYRFGVTGTFPKPELDQYSLKSAIGVILKEIPARWLMDNGYLAKVSIEPIKTKISDVDIEDLPDFNAEKALLMKSTDRLDFLADLIISASEQYGNTLVLVNNVDFGKNIQKLINDSIFLYGASEKAERKKHYTEFDNVDNKIAIATFGIASTGISIDRVFCLIMIDSGKSFVRCIQSIGRSLRMASDKKEAYVIDVFGDYKWSKKHYTARAKYYKEANYEYSKPKTIKL